MTAKNKPRKCVKCHQLLPVSLFTGSGKTCAFCKSRKYNPLAKDLQTKDEAIFNLKNQVRDLQKEVERSGAQALKLSSAQESGLLGDLHVILRNSKIQKPETKRSVYFQNTEQYAVLKRISDRLGVDCSATASILFEYLKRAMTPAEQKKIEEIAIEERRKGEERAQKRRNQA